jgi:hypothetical protein
MDHDGFAASSEEFDHYVGEIVNPALENFDRIGSKLFATTSLSHGTMLGHEKLAGSTEFTDTCRRMLDKFFEAHQTLLERQCALVETVTRFRDNLRESSAAYAQNEAGKAQSMGNLSRQLETRLRSDGAPG